MRVRLIAVAVLAVVASAALGGCASVKSSLDARFTPKPQLITQEATVAATGASIIGKIPPGFPRTLPMWPGARVYRTKVTNTRNGKPSYILSTWTRDPFADVLAGLGKGFLDGGWKVRGTDVSIDKQKVVILTISGLGSEGIVTVSQIASRPVTIDYVVGPKK